MNLKQVLPAFLLLSATFNSNSLAQSSPTKSIRTSGTIAGRVTAHGKGLAGVTVTLRSGGFGGFGGFVGGAAGLDLPGSKTDADGNYRITGVPPGSYVVTPVAPVYTTPGNTRFTSANEPVVVTGNDNIDGIDFTLVPGGVVTGKVTDADGRPVIEQTVSLLMQNVDAMTPRNGPAFAPGNNFRTDDRGVYRIYGIPAGRYKVSVGAQQAFGAFATVTGQVAYKQTFHPDTSDPAQATTIEVAEGAEVSNVDITVGRTVDAYAVTGRVLDRDSSSPIPNIGFTLSIVAGGGDRQRQMGFINLPVTSDGNGQFRVDNLAPGRYVISVAPQTGNGMSGQSAPFDVIDQDVKGVEVRAVKGASLSGFVVLDGNPDPSIQAQLSQLQVTVFVQGGSTPGPGQVISLNSDRSFSVTGLSSGTVRLQLMAQDPALQGAFKLLRVERNGAPQPQGITVNAGDQVTGIRLVAAYADGIVQGALKFQNGTPDPSMRFFAMLSQGAQTRGMANATNVDSRGHFLIQNVPAGNYTLTVSSMGRGMRRGGQQQPPPSTQQPVTVTEGQITTVNLTLDLGQETPPPPGP